MTTFPTTRIFSLTFAVVVGAAAAVATCGMSPLQAEQRYTIQETSDGGFLRLDQQTGGVLKCTGRNDTIVCTAVTDDTVALREELAELKAENEALKQRVAELEKLAKATDTGLTEPAKKQIEEIFGFFEDMVRRLMRFAQGAQTKSGEDI
jgi:hypothetical protein